MINTQDTGGAAKSCIRLHLGLKNQNIDSNILFLRRKINVPFSIQETAILRKSSLMSFLSKVFKKGFNKIGLDYKSDRDSFLNKRNPSLELFSFPQSNYDITKSSYYKDSDIINLHWVATFLDFETFFKKNKKPVVWTLHDMNPFTGGEHYIEKYLGIDHEGNPLKRYLSNDESLVYERIEKKKSKIIADVEKLVIVAPSKWLADKAVSSKVFNGKEVLHIPYGLDSEVFKNRNQEFSKDVLGIPKNKFVLLFVADSIDNNRKGFAFLKKALQQMDRDDLVLVAVGRKLEESISLKNIIELGSLEDERMMSLAYSSADAFVIPSLMDNLPNTVLESIMCGTPVIGFPVGGINDMIQNEKNGLLAEEISVQSLLNAIEKFLKISKSFDRKKIREEAISLYSQEIQAKKYAELFKTILSK